MKQKRLLNYSATKTAFTGVVKVASVNFILNEYMMLTMMMPWQPASVTSRQA